MLFNVQGGQSCHAASCSPSRSARNCWHSPARRVRADPPLHPDPGRSHIHSSTSRRSQPTRHYDPAVLSAPSRPSPGRGRDATAGIDRYRRSAAEGLAGVGCLRALRPDAARASVRTGAMVRPAALHARSLHLEGVRQRLSEKPGRPAGDAPVDRPSERQLQVTVTVGYAPAFPWLALTTVPLPLAMLQVMPPGSVMVVPPPPKVT